MQGLFFDPPTMAVLANTAAMARALDMYRQLARYSPPLAAGSNGSSCELVSAAFAAGRCAVALGSGRQFKRNQAERTTRGLVGVELLPGSTTVLDRGSGALVDCTSSLCPHAMPRLGITGGAADNSSSGGGGPALVSRTPLVGMGALVISIGEQSSWLSLLLAAGGIKMLVTPQISWNMVRVV